MNYLVFMYSVFTLLVPSILSAPFRVWDLCTVSSWANSHTLSSYFGVSLSPDTTVLRPGLQESCQLDFSLIYCSTVETGDEDAPIYEGYCLGTEVESESVPTSLYFIYNEKAN